MSTVKKKHPLRRMVLCTAATVSGIVLMLALKQPAPGTAAATAPVQVGAVAGSPTASAAATGSAAASAGSVQGSASASAPASAPSAAKSSAPAAANVTRSVTGDTAQTQYGPVQVEITMTGTKITAATALQHPTGGQSDQINANAVPKLNQEAVTAQSASIDAVSGASYTSAGYKQSLQSALDKAGV
ncbi:FMN-binding protein [Actinacidiphila oryziradicis]|uniref:FMN-binding protein n=1 Tax=Actinacidiphila oryziradicis TaxID=2571141 RepID=UPI003211EA0D